MYIKRDIEDELLAWKNRDGHLVLELSGGRQVGKTTTLMHFANENYKNVVYIDFTSSPVITAFHTAYFNNVDTLSVIKDFCEKRKLSFSNDPNTLLIFDEVQESKEAYEMIRPIRRKMQCDLIVTGSYLQKALEYFQPVGDITKLEMHSISFSEFVRIFGKDQEYAMLPIDGTQIEDSWFAMAYEAYTTVGGYPYAVTHFLDNKDPQAAIAEIWDALLQEIKSRAGIQVYMRIPVLVHGLLDIMLREKRGNKLQMERLVETMLKYNVLNPSRKEVFGAMSWLLESHVLSYCSRYNFQDGQITDLTRCFFNDVGLLRYLLEKYDAQPSTIEGLISEAFVYGSLRRTPKRVVEEFISFGVLGDCEFDFTFPSLADKARYTLEVKAGKGNNKHCQTLLDEGLTDYVINFKGNTKGGITEDGKMLTLPLWLIDRFPFDLAGRVEKHEIKASDLFNA